MYINPIVSTVIAKPTRLCQADCAYCSTPPDGEGSWSFEDFKSYFDKIYPYLTDGANWIWHGGEPMLMGPDFYIKAFEYASLQMKRDNKKILFSMQTNILAYDHTKWFHVFQDIFKGSISTSFELNNKFRTIKGNSDKYTKVFNEKLNMMLDDGFRPLVISVYSEENASTMSDLYDYSKSFGDKSFPLRFNYCHPSGKYEGSGEAISPDTYAKYLIEVYNKWILEVPNFTITPLDQMFKKIVNIDDFGNCPWTRHCGGRFIEVEPNGDVYNCSEFADISTISDNNYRKYSYGNLKSNLTLGDMLSSKPAQLIKRRSVNTPPSCQTCEHYSECEGGCMRDALLYSKGLYGKFHYCVSWKKVFTRIKESIIGGECDAVIEKYGLNLEIVKNNLKTRVINYFNFDTQEYSNIEKHGANSPYGFGDNYLVKNKMNNYSDKGEYSNVLNLPETIKNNTSEDLLFLNNNINNRKVIFIKNKKS